MNKYRRLSYAIMTVMVVIILPITAYADSSWRWISETRPYDVLPYVAIGTILIETFAISIIPKTGKLLKVFCVVTLANLLSFAAPYILYLGSPIYNFSQMLNHLPSFTVGITYLTITIAVELPVVYLFLKKDAEKKSTLLWTIIASNTTTTILVAIVERTLCRGTW